MWDFKRVLEQERVEIQTVQKTTWIYQIKWVWGVSKESRWMERTTWKTGKRVKGSPFFRDIINW
jgi:hypothetical protein